MPNSIILTGPPTLQAIKGFDRPNELLYLYSANWMYVGYRKQVFAFIREKEIKKFVLTTKYYSNE